MTIANSFADYLPLAAVRTAPGEYEIRAGQGHLLWRMEGAALAEWVCRAVNGWAQMHATLQGAHINLSDIFERGQLTPEQFELLRTVEKPIADMLYELEKQS